ncbi:MAG: prephenate dehydrogenase/arogenate dehydrogenase family protein, partial [Bacteroidales bacterium]|nr:prephenate dehydrogenase/arogenate dehydrogenase family protein [Bacteroidales bacterium]
MNIVVIGTGLIGGSMALSARGFETKIIGVDASEENLKKAMELGIIDMAMPLEQAVQIADLIIISIPVDAAREMLPSILDNIRDDAVVIDTGSTKAGICGKVRNHPRRGNFVASHPMAGTEFSGPTAALVGLFKDKKAIICEKELSSDFALKRALMLYKLLGMSVLYMSAEDHDK